MKLRGVLSMIVAITSGCAETGQDQARIPLFVAGSDLSEPIVALGGVRVAIDRADLAFGPLYLCAGATAGDLCDTARLEWLDTVVLDATDPTPVQAGELEGVTGPVRSWMYDLGISSQLTRDDPFVLAAAAQLGGASFVLTGKVELERIERAFFASVPIQQTDETELGVPVVRKSASEPFQHDVTGEESGLLVRFDARAWVRAVDFRPYLTEEACADGACADELTLEPDSQAFRSLRNALLSGGRPSFSWNIRP